MSALGMARVGGSTHLFSIRSHSVRLSIPTWCNSSRINTRPKACCPSDVEILKSTPLCASSCDARGIRAGSNGADLCQRSPLRCVPNSRCLAASGSLHPSRRLESSRRNCLSRSVTSRPVSGLLHLWSNPRTCSFCLRKGSCRSAAPTTRLVLMSFSESSSSGCRQVFHTWQDDTLSSSPPVFLPLSLLPFPSHSTHVHQLRPRVLEMVTSSRCTRL